MLPAPLLAASRVALALEGLRVPYMVAGSLASSTYGTPRSTQDVDLVADLRHEHVARFVEALGEAFYADAEMIRDAIGHRSSFNVIHLPTMYKVDVFLLKADPWAREEMARRRVERIALGDDAIELHLCSPEDTVLHKLDWYRAGGGVSDRQWSDVLGVLKVQAEALDLGYMRRWAGEVGLTDLLERALSEAEPEEEAEPPP